MLIQSRKTLAGGALDGKSTSLATAGQWRPAPIKQPFSLRHRIGPREPDADPGVWIVGSPAGRGIEPSFYRRHMTLKIPTLARSLRDGQAMRAIFIQAL